MAVKFAGYSRGGSSMQFTIVPFTKGKNPKAARAHARTFMYGSTGGPYPGYYNALRQAQTGVDPSSPTPDEAQTVAAVTATNDLTTTCCTVTQDGVVTSVTYTPASTITGAASPASRTFQLVNTGSDGNGTAVIATLAMTSGVNATGSAAKTIPLTTTAELKAVGAGDVIKWVSTHIGATGLADPGGTVNITFAEV